MADKPNVLYVVYDDLRPELGCYGHPTIKSPNIDKLASEGLTFQRAYCQQAICGPSRVSALSGCRPDTTRVYDLSTSMREAMPDVLSLPEHFKNNGYETVSIGKVYHHPKDDLQGWSTDPYQAKGDWQGRGYLTDEAIDEVNAFNARVEGTKETRRGLGPAFEGADVHDEAYHDGANTHFCLRELDRLAAQADKKPFFLGMGFIKPHLPFNAPKKYWDLYDPEEIDLAPNPFAPAGVTEYSLVDFGELRGYSNIPDEGPVPNDLARELKHGYYACISYVDALLGRVLDKLEELGQKDNTIVILWGDHGWKLGEHGSWCKHSNFEIDARAPMIISAPGMKAKGKHTMALADFVDMYPTLAELCGLEVPAHCEGTSFKPLLDEPDRPWKKAAFSQYPRHGNVMGYTMRTERYRYTEWQDHDTGEVKARELYDHEKDPQENINAVDKPENADIIKKLSEQLKAGWQAAKS